MATSNDDLVVKIKADIRALQAGLRQAAKEADIAGKTMKTSIGDRMDAIQKALATGARAAGAAFLGIGTAAAAAGGTLAVLLNKALDTADALQQLKDKTGISAEEIQRLQYAAKQFGVETEDLSGALGKFSLELGKAQSGSKDAAAGFQALGVALTDENGPRKAEAVLLDVFRALEKIPDASTRAAAAAEVFGKTGVNVALIASQGAGALDEMRRKADDLGIVLSDDLVGAGDNAGDAIDRLKTVISAGLNKALLQAAPEIEKFINDLLADPKGMQERIQQFVDAAGAIVKVAGAAAGAIGSVVKFAEALGAAVAEMVHGSDTPFEDELTKIGDKIDMLQMDLNNLDETHPDFAFVRGQLEEQLKKYSELKKAQEDWLNLGKTQPPKPEAPVTPPAGGDGAGFVTSEGSAAAKQAEAAARQKREAIARELQGEIKDEIQAEAEILDAQKAAADQRAELEQSYRDDHEAGLQEIEDSLLDAQARQLLDEDKYYRKKLAALAGYNDAELEAIGGYNSVKEQMTQDHEEALRKIRESYLTSGLNFLAGIEDDKQRTAADAFAKNIQTLGTQSKKAFEISKAAAIADTVINTYKAATGAYSALASIPIVGPALGAAAAAAAIAAGLANIQAIKNTRFGGGASAGVPGGANPQGGVFGDGNGSGARPPIQLTLVGGNFSADQVRGLIDQINEAQSDGSPPFKKR